MSTILGSKKISEKAQSTLKAMRELLEEEGTDIVHKIYAETIREMREQQYVKRYDLTKSSVNRYCLCRLVGKQCPWMYGHSEKGCITFKGIDHSSLWNRNGKPFVYISQPYGIDLEDLKSLIEVCEKHNLVVNIDAYSWWYPDSTVFIAIHKRGWWQELDADKREQAE